MKTVIHMLATLTIVGVISGALLSEISSWAEPQIAEHRKKETEKAIFEVQPGASSYEVVEEVDFQLFRTYDDNKEFLGYALPYEGNGFQGKIRLMVGTDPEITKVTGLKVLEQVETPGLGTKIVVDPSNKEEQYWFSDQFKQLNSKPQIDVVKNQKPTKDNQIQAITGATISSKAVVSIINNGLERLRGAIEQEVSYYGR